MIELTDTHCHIHEIVRRATPVYDKWHEKGEVDVGQIIADAKAAGVTKLICVGTTLDDSRLAVEFVQNQSSCWSSVGIHPHEAQSHNTAKTMEQFSDLLKGSLKEEKIVAIGECGLDYFYGHSPKEDQIELLKFQIEQALAHDLPLILHVREAFDDFWPIFESYQGIRGVLHSFTDFAQNLEKALGKGLFIGVNGISTFTKDSEQLKIYKTIPLGSLLLETDAPFLTPTPYRGKINEPKYVRTITEFLSELRDEGLGEISKTTTQNAQKLFGIG